MRFGARGAAAQPMDGAAHDDRRAQPVRPPSAWRVLRQREYALLFWGQLVSATGTQMQIVAVSWQVYLLTHSALALGLIGLLQAIPRLLFSLVGGVFADAFDRRKLLLIVETGLALTSAVLAICTMAHAVSMLLIGAVVLLAASVSAFEFPARQAIVPMLVPREQMQDALSLSMVSVQLTFILGPTLGGFAILWPGVAGTYWIDVASYVTVIGSLVLLRIPGPVVTQRAQAGIGAMLDGFRFLREHPVILALLSLDFFANFFGSPRALLPFYASDILRIGPQGLGLLLAATSIGAVLLTPFASRIGRFARQGVGVVAAILVWGLCIVLFGFLPGPFWLSLLLLAGAGAADMVSVILRGIVTQLVTPDALRGRMNAVRAMFVIGGPTLGQFESGVVAWLLSPQASVISGGIACLVMTMAIAAAVPKLLRTEVT